MRLNLSPAEFDAEGFEETSRPHIANKNNAKIFYMLTSGFYSRPRESMFREICANALDESPHASRPFMVALPHALQPELVVRDWGRGMSHDFVMRRAMSLGDSTKDHDDKAIGGFGLGMKTPFCVTEQFSLVIYRGDHKQTYVIDREGGTPRPMTSPEMIEALEGGEQCTGTEIRIPIPEKNWGEFREIAQRILQLFPAESFEIAGAHVSPPEYVREAAKYAVLKQSSAPGIHACPLSQVNSYWQSGRDGRTVIELHVWPEHIASLPRDYRSEGKVRLQSAFVARALAADAGESDLTGRA